MSTIARAIYWLLGGAQAVVELASAARRLVKQARRGTLPNVNDTDPIPLKRERIYLKPPPLPREPLKRR